MSPVGDEPATPATDADDFDVGAYWDGRYRQGGTSGKGSYGRLAEFKAEVINGILEAQDIGSVVELGCGDGNQLSLLRIPGRYMGLDISPKAVEICRARHAGRPQLEFHTYSDFPVERRYDLAMSIDVIFHLVDDAVYEAYMNRLFAYSTRWVLVYSSNYDAPGKGVHVRHRAFGDWIARNAPDWALVKFIPNRYPIRWYSRRDRSFCQFYLYERRAAA